MVRPPQLHCPALRVTDRPLHHKRRRRATRALAGDSKSPRSMHHDWHCAGASSSALPPT